MVEKIQRQKVPVWSRSINFKVYHFERAIKYNELKKAVENKSGNLENKKEGWLTTFPYIKSNKIIAYMYIKFKRDAAASRAEGHEVLVADPVVCNFYLDDGLAIVSTASESKLTYIVEKRMFDTLDFIERPVGIEYSTRFLYWLAYMHQLGGKKITDDISIEDVQSISSDLEKANLSDSSRANTEVTSYLHAKTILASNGFANAARIEIDSNKKSYSIKLTSDGRINIKPEESIEGKEEKALYALENHEILQKIYKIYSSQKDSTSWEKNKLKYRCFLIKNCVDELNDLLSTLKGEYNKF